MLAFFKNNRWLMTVGLGFTIVLIASRALADNQPLLLTQAGSIFN